MTWSDYDPADLLREIEDRRNALRAEYEATEAERRRATGDQATELLVRREVLREFLDALGGIHGRALADLHNGHQGRTRGLPAFQALRRLSLAHLLALGRT